MTKWKKKIFHFIEKIRLLSNSIHPSKNWQKRNNVVPFKRFKISTRVPQRAKLCRLAKVAPSSNRTTVPKYEKEENKGEGIKRSFYVRACNRRDERATKETIGRRESLVSGRFFPSFESERDTIISSLIVFEFKTGRKRERKSEK